MTAMEHLKLEFANIDGSIRSYSNESKIINYLDRLKEAIINRNLEYIKYCLNGIEKWYQRQINIISSEDSTLNESEQCSHSQNIALIGQLIKEFENYQIEEVSDIMKEQTNSPNNDPIIFLSHKSNDKKYGDALRNYIIGLGVPEHSLIYTSHPLHKIPMDRNIYDYLRENISGHVFVIILWSDAYLESPACLNEMGAGWVAQKDYTNIYVPSFSFGNPKYHQCAVDTRKMGPVLNGDEHCKMSMIELKNKIQRIFNLKNDEAKSQYLLDQFIKEITEA